MNITITPGAATEDAMRIDEIINNIENNMEVLDTAIKRNIPDGIETTWSEEVKNNWQSYYTGDIPQAMQDMKLSATNLRLAVDQALKYSEQK